MLPNVSYLTVDEAIECRSNTKGLILGAQQTVEFLCKGYGLDGEPPKLYFFDSPAYEAYASEDEGILVSLAVIDLLAAADETLAKSELRSPGGAIGLAGIVWVICHEFFHFGRAHFEVSRLRGDRIRALEYDADCMATAGTYRALEATAIFKQRFNPLDLKRIVLWGLFWPIRMAFRSAIQNSEASSTHPAWFHRLHYMKMKLAWTRWVRMSELDTATGGYDSRMGEEIKIFSNDLISLEHLYGTLVEAKAPDRKKAVSDLPFIAYTRELLTSNSAEDQLLRDQWAEIEPLVDQCQRLKVLSTPPAGMAPRKMLKDLTGGKQG